MDRILVLGGGVGGTLTANLLARRLKKRIDAGDVDLAVVDASGAHVYQPGFMYIAMGGEQGADQELGDCACDVHGCISKEPDC